MNELGSTNDDDYAKGNLKGSILVYPTCCHLLSRPKLNDYAPLQTNMDRENGPCKPIFLYHPVVFRVQVHLQGSLPILLPSTRLPDRPAPRLGVPRERRISEPWSPST